MADCHFNLGMVFKKLGMSVRSLEHWKAAFEIRRKIIGPMSMPVSDLLEHIGKYELELGDLKQAYDSL